MSPKEDLPEITLEINIPVIVKPWRARAVTTKYGQKLMLVVKDGNVESEVKWLPIDLANDLVKLGVMELGKWDDGNVKYSIKKGAPEIAICKRQAKGEPHPHYEVAIPGEQDGPDMPARSSAPAASPKPAAQAAASDRGTPPDYVSAAVSETKRLCMGLGIENFDDPLVAQAVIECAEKIYVTLRIEGQR